MSRDFQQEAMEALADLSRTDVDALRTAGRLIQRSRSNDTSKAFTLWMAMNVRAAKRDRRTDADALDRWADDGGTAP